MVIHRAEITTNVSRNIEARYTGRIAGDRIEGQMSWWTPGSRPVSQSWSAQIGSVPEQQVLAAQLQQQLAARGWGPLSPDALVPVQAAGAVALRNNPTGPPGIWRRCQALTPPRASFAAAATS